MITIETIDRSDGRDKIVGFAYFPLFIDGMTKTPVTNRNNTNNILQTGFY
jgi:hypothetical protein